MALHLYCGTEREDWDCARDANVSNLSTDAIQAASSGIVAGISRVVAFDDNDVTQSQDSLLYMYM